MPEDVMLPQVSFVCIGKYNLNDLFKDAYQPLLLLALKAWKQLFSSREKGEGDPVLPFLQLLGYGLEKAIFLFNPQH